MDQTVLVVEDEVEINELLREYLTLEGLKALSAADGKTALVTAYGSHPDVVVLDVMLPDIDGFEICRQLTTHRETALIPVILLTCMNQNCDRLKGLSAGAFRYINKPFLPDDLISQIKAGFEWHRQMTARPPCGQFEISASLEAFLHGLNDMISAMFAHCELPDKAVTGVRDAFQAFQQQALQWGNRMKRDPHLLIQYRLNTGGELAKSQPADSVEWILSEQDPGLLAQVVLKAPMQAFFSSTPVSGTLQRSSTSEPLAAWYEFLARVGVASFEKDAKIGQIKLRRSLKSSETPAVTPVSPSSGTNTTLTPPATPPLTTDGTRLNNRLALEVVTSKPR